MKLIASLFAALIATNTMVASSGDPEIISYSFPEGNSGLRIAWRSDSTQQWQPLGYDFIKNDFGPWGSHKKMYCPKLFLNGADGKWIVIWNATKNGEVIAISESENLTSWSPQRYFASIHDLPRDIYSLNAVYSDSAEIEGKKIRGYVQTMPQKTVDNLKSYVAKRDSLSSLYAEQTKDDPKRFAGLGTIDVKIIPEPGKSKEISNELIGIFFEDINYSADGGLYAELIQNRDFEYSSTDRKEWNAMTAWKSQGEGDVEIKTDNPIHHNNPHYASVTSGKESFTLCNEGYDFISLKKGEKYRFSIKARSATHTPIEIRLVDTNGKTLGKNSFKIKSDKWTDYKAIISPAATSDSSLLQLIFPKNSSADIDMVSLFPINTFKNRENGLRSDIATTLADLNPKFVRFPGGCVAHGNGIDNIYDWKGSIGPLESRKPLRNLWGYHQTRGLGYHEYFLFCEDIGAEPLPVVAAGVPCQNSGIASHHSDCVQTTLGQQNGIPMEEMASYIQDVLDLIEYANGDVTTEWGAKRADAGHPEPFNLKYIGIGNEDMITEVFEPRFKMIFDAVKEKYPEVTVIGTVGPFYEGTDYDEGWRLARELHIPMVDEHYYVAPGWYIYNRDYYDKYPRNATKVYLGEYASHLPGRPCNIETALSIALYLTDIERNGDVVSMTSFAPLLAKRGHTQWNPDLIYFDNTSVYPTVDYQVQKIYGNNTGDVYIPSGITIANEDNKVKSRIGSSIVKDSTTGDIIVKIVNMLPVKINVDLDLKKLGINQTCAKALQLCGQPDEKKAVPENVVFNLPSGTLPPYSFTVLRFPSDK